MVLRALRRPCVSTSSSNKQYYRTEITNRITTRYSLHASHLAGTAGQSVTIPAIWKDGRCVTRRPLESSRYDSLLRLEHHVNRRCGGVASRKGQNRWLKILIYSTFSNHKDTSYQGQDAHSLQGRESGTDRSSIRNFLIGQCAHIAYTRLFSSPVPSPFARAPRTAPNRRKGL